jgi:anti-sigma factor RsiW
MKSCTRARDLFGPYWDDETTLAEREWLEGHLATCVACRESYEQLTRTLEAVATLPREEAAPDLAQRVLAAARRATPARDVVFVRETPRWVPLTAVAAAVLLVATSIVPYLTQTRMPSTLVRRETPIVEPRLVAAGAESHAVSRDGLHHGSPAMSDSLFDHSEDVDFVLDPVTLHRGRARTTTRLPQGVQGEQAVITF